VRASISRLSFSGSGAADLSEEGTLRELLQGQCFYCSKAIDEAGEVDHFVA
jgi:hypothetical protein